MMVHAGPAPPPGHQDAPAPPGAGERHLAVTDSVLLGGMITLFVGSFVWLTWLTHARFGTFGFDLGIFDQGVWLLSRFRDPFVTIRGLPLFGDHASYILVLIAPLYWIGANPRLLLLLQVVALAIPAASVYLIGIRRLGSPLAGLSVAAAYLAFPALQWALTVSWLRLPDPQWRLAPALVTPAGRLLGGWPVESSTWPSAARWGCHSTIPRAGSRGSGGQRHSRSSAKPESTASPLMSRCCG
jgi:Predicted membrane protein (DUF2079)